VQVRWGESGGPEDRGEPGRRSGMKGPERKSGGSGDVAVIMGGIMMEVERS